MKNFMVRRHALRALAFALPVLAGLGVTVPASAQVIYLAPPAPVYEVAPPPRVGYLWQPGYWGWQYGRYVWVPGHWVVVGAAPPVVRAPAEVGQVIRLSADALFPFDRGSESDLLPGGREDIRQVAERLRGMSFRRIEVRGYTDRLGSPAYNLELSRRRANAVKALLIEDGVDAGRIDAVGMGEQDPVSHCDAGLSGAALVSCLQPDRRVEIVTYAATR